MFAWATQIITQLLKLNKLLIKQSNHYFLFLRFCINKEMHTVNLIYCLSIKHYICNYKKKM